MAKKSARKVAEVKTKYGSYKAVFERGDDQSGYVVTAPRVPGTVSWGKSLAEARKMIAEAIELSVECEPIITRLKRYRFNTSSANARAPVLT